MAIFFQNYSINIFLVFCVQSLIYGTYTSFSGYLATADLLTRLNANDAFVSTFYFFWTNFVYLPTFFFLFLIITALFSLTGWLRVAFWLVTPIWIAYNVELLDYTLLSLHPSLGTYGSTDLNPLLSNSLNRYHPAVFYLSVSLAFTFLFPRIAVIYQRVNQVKFRATWTNQPLPLATALVNLIALWMGSWWALQEGTWGGWWNWDPSEMFGLLFTFTMIWFLHSKTLNQELVWAYLKATLVACSLLQAYFFIQLNFDLVSHNFGSKFFFFFNHNLFFLEGLALTGWIVSSTYGFQTWIATRTASRDNATFLKKSFYQRIFIWLILLTWLLYSYQGLLSYFAWNFAGLTLLNTTYSLWASHVLLILIFVIWLNPFKGMKPAYFVVLLSTCSLSLTTTLVQLRFNWNWQLLTHVLLLLLGYVISFYSDLDSITWVSVNNLVLSNENYSLITRNAELIVLENAAWEETKVFTSSNLNSVSYWQNFSFSNISIVNPFLLLTSHTNFTNFYFLSQTYVLIFLDLKVIAAPIANFIFLIFISIFIWTINRRVH